jgi:adenylate cyclase
VLSRFGDVFGPSVNVAARLTDIADPSTVLTDPATARLLAREEGLVLETLPERELEGIGAMAPVRVRTA